MAEDRQEQKQTKEDAEKEVTEESTLTLEPSLSEDEHELPANAAEHDPSEVLCPGHIILKALQQVVSESKKTLHRVPDLKSKCSKSKKACKKKPLMRPVDPEETNCLHAENENSLLEPTTDLLSSLANALEYFEKTSSTITPGSRLQSPIEENLQYEDLYSLEELDEVEFMAEIRLGDVEAYSSRRSGIFRDRHWRFQKSVCLSTSGLQLAEGQSAIEETASRPSRTEDSLEHLKYPLNINPCMPRTLHRTSLSTKCDVIQNSKDFHYKDLNRTSQQKSPSKAIVVPGLLWPENSPMDAFSISRVQNKFCSNRTTLINSNTQFVKNQPDALVSVGLALGNGTGVTGGQQRPLSGEGSTSNSQHTQPTGSLEKTDSSSSYSSSSSQNPAGGSGTQSTMSQDLDIYDPFHPTDEENVNGDYIYEDSPGKEMDEQEDQKYDPFDPTGSNPSSSEHSPSPYEDDDDDDIDSESHPEGRISEALAGIYDENSLSQEYPGIDKNREGSNSAECDKFQGIDEHEGGNEVDSNKEQRLPKDPLDTASKNVSKLDFEPYSPSSSIDLDTTDEMELQETSKVSEEKNVNEPPAADSTLDEISPSDTSVEPIRRVFTVDVGQDFSRKTDFTSEAESKSKVEIKVSLESLAKPDMKSYLRLEKIAKLGSESRSRHKRRHSSERRDRDDDSDRKYDSEIEEGEIVQPDEDCFSPMPLFRSRCRVIERPLRMVEGDDFLSLHADSDEEGALQIDFGENQMENRWKGLDLRRKITNQRRERYRKKSISPTRPKKQSKSRSPSSSHSRKKPKRERKRSREQRRSKEPRPSGSWSSAKKLGKESKDRKRSRSRSYNKISRSLSRDRRRSRSWSPSISTSLSAVESSRTSAERRKSRRSKSKEKRRRWSNSGSTDRDRKDKHKEKHRSDAKKKKKRSRSKSRERDRDRRSSRHSNERKDKDKPRSRHLLDEPKAENPPLLERRRRDSRSVVPPSIQDLNNADLFTIKRTITINPEEKLAREELLRSPELSGKREVLYDSEGLSFETYSDRETLDDRDGKCNRPFDRRSGKSDSGKRRLPMEFDTKRVEEDRESRQKISKERDRKRDRSYTDDSRERYKKRFKDVPEPEPLKLDREKVRVEKDKTPKKIKTSHKDGKGSSTRKVKLQSKVAVLIREGVSSTTSVKEAGSIGVKFSRDRESRSPFLKSEEKMADIKGGRPKPETEDLKEPLLRPKKLKSLKTKTGVKKVKSAGGGGALVKTKGTLEKKKKKLKTKASLKKSKADSCSQEVLSPIETKDEPIWSDTEKSEIIVKPPSPPKPANEQELTPDSQTVDSSCKTPDVSFMPEELPPDPERSIDLEVDSISEPKEEGPRPAHPPPPPPAPMSWNLQSGVDCATSGVLALTALLFKMEEANMASRAKAQELIQATNQILSHSKPSTSLGNQPPPLPALGHSAPPYLLGGLPLSSSSSPPTPTGIAGLNSQSLSGSTSSSFFNTTAISELGKREGSTSSEGRGDTDKYLKKLHTQERAVEEVKLAIKPYYQRKEITKDDYKDILRKAVHKICHSKSGEINPVKVNNLVKAYVQRYKYFRKHGKKMDDDESASSYRSGKDQGALEKALPPLPLI
ncbi:LOW QUALITY PROTEIN: splicing factor, arginine/serine-rich 19 [Bufo gargarizans]|uniref:LOW QUALITY PROTEIN: splicing factor, arginine/serine-rich 19 n=1 Tax=Bufo gargarizans TaxID=30331 RepID=UPI001CF3347E|nr:LOW QUALITY PROTEIN: splicing factor, arginine/serine-rich 19 [Bufo gargarizans]